MELAQGCSCTNVNEKKIKQYSNLSRVRVEGMRKLICLAGRKLRMEVVVNSRIFGWFFVAWN